MKVTLICFTLFAIAKGSPVNPFDESIDNFVVADSDIKIYFRTQRNPNDKNPIDVSNPYEVLKKGFSKDKDTVFIIHGWKNEHDSPICEEVSEAILKVKDANVFVVDWSKIAKNLYLIARNAVPDVAKVVDKVLNGLHGSNQLNLDKTIIIGHSLGAHVAGLCGHGLNGQINRIVGLDPALPLFEWSDLNGRLDPTDAKFVQVIHSCAGLLGYNRDIGHVDYYPNGGSSQPGCNFDITGACSHGRSYHYFAESVVSGGFVAHKCDNYNDYKNGKCNSNPTSLMGQYEPDRRASGRYYLQTNSNPPYAKH